MSDVRLPRDQELQLLKRLSTDDDFRSRFASDPTGALKEIGVGDDAIAKLDPANLKPGKLADKDAIAAAHAQLNESGISDHVCLIIPFARLDIGK